MPIKRFEQMCEETSLYFVNPFVKWTDKKEGFLYRAATENSEKIRNILEKRKFGKQQYQLFVNGGLFPKEEKESLDWFSMRCQSWCKTENSGYMWEEYGKENGICISVESARLLQLYYDRHKVEGMNVKYVEERDIEQEIDELRGKHGEFYFTKALQIKNKNPFEEEDEYRLYVILLDEKGHNICENNVEGVNIPINEAIESFIEKVYVSPFAGVGIKKDTLRICKKYGIDRSRIVF